MKKFLVTFFIAGFFLFGTTIGVFAASNTYTVKQGDSLYRIVRTYKTSVANLKKWNNLRSDMIKVNQKLLVSPASSTKTLATKQTSQSKAVTTLSVNASAYTLTCKGCSGKTAIGLNLKKNPNLKVISVDPKVIKLGTKVYVEGYGYAIAADKGSAIKGNKIDVFFPTYKQAINWGRKTVKVKLLN